MATDKEKATWETKLQEAGYVIRTIRTQNDGMMEAIFNLLEIAQDDYPKQTQLLDFIDGHQGLKAGAVDHQHGDPRKKAKISCLDVMKSSPLDVRPPPTPDSPRFVCPKNWYGEVEFTIQNQLDAYDSEPSESYRVEPLAVSRCSRGGKTRSLIEIANMNFTHGKQKVPVVFVSFNDYSPLDSHDQENPLEALLLRIAFAAWKEIDKKYKPQVKLDPTESPHSKTKTLLSSVFTAFRKDYHVTEEDVLNWLGDAPALLIVDELNNLDKLAVKDSAETKKMVDFIKTYFLKEQGRYFVFSTHTLSTLECFGVYMEHSSNSDRGVLLQELPLVEDLASAKALNENLKGVREAIYYGLMPGLIHDRSKRSPRSVLVKWNSRMNEHNKKTPEKRKKAFLDVLKSLINGDVSLVPTQFHTFLDAVNAAAGSERVRWSPHHLEFVLRKLALDDDEDDYLAKSKGELCKNVLTAKEQSGDGWEALFVLFLLARCVTKSWREPILPDVGRFFESGEKTVVLFNQPFCGRFKLLDKCECWSDLEKEILPGEAPTISIYYPTHAKFRAYDVILVASEKKKITGKVGYQCKEGKNDATQGVEQEFDSSFVLKGPSPVDSSHKVSWIIPSDDDIDAFFGVSGKHWTPKQWKKLAATAGVSSDSDQAK